MPRRKSSWSWPSKSSKAGWDAAFGWETVYGIDPWVVLGGMAAKTERIKLGTLLTPPSRRRPWKLASELVTLDQIRTAARCSARAWRTRYRLRRGRRGNRAQEARRADGRVPRIAGSILDRQTIPVRWAHYHVDWTASMGAVTPIQQPRIPIWNVGLMGSKTSMRRAARWDGVLPNARDAEGTGQHLVRIKFRRYVPS